MRLTVFICFLTIFSFKSYAQNATATLTIILSDVQSVKVKSVPAIEQNNKITTVQPEISLLNSSSSEVRRFTANSEALAVYAQNVRSNQDVTPKSKEELEFDNAQNSSLQTLLVYEINPK